MLATGLKSTYIIANVVYSLVPYGFDRDTVDQSTKFCTVIPLDILEGGPLLNNPVPLSTVPNFTNPQKLNLHLLIQFICILIVQCLCMTWNSP